MTYCISISSINHENISIMKVSSIGETKDRSGNSALGDIFKYIQLLVQIHVSVCVCVCTWTQAWRVGGKHEKGQSEGKGRGGKEREGKGGEGSLTPSFPPLFPPFPKTQSDTSFTFPTLRERERERERVSR